MTLVRKLLGERKGHSRREREEGWVIVEGRTGRRWERNTLVKTSEGMILRLGQERGGRKILNVMEEGRQECMEEGTEKNVEEGED